ncbi:Dephospho-CoA kinase/protein folding accessory domain-containing protein [Pseudodesulfovibrio profundus]|uniref:Dephospho-CoA kinase/protein folding accessory domain-containing protein n=1 Tax=Pseudodesulfovibrio profundus TaxID=57320 RepID=A0A2C8F924_9BACT|nr:GrpB family protein [Pseudodesulfovibrio profundus]SOB58542.1 Dephospho-CoA kinase/protein folding accessory domain-containing protein [Pseudodesulfovibrio profundus]
MTTGETLEEKIQRVLRDHVELVEYDPAWPAMFEAEKKHLLGLFPGGLIRRVEHYGSTSIPGMTAKPIVDMLIEVRDLEETRQAVPPVLEALGYDFFWRPLGENDGPPHYAWFIKRDRQGRRTHHLHMVEADSFVWEGLVFRDYLLAHPEWAARYLELKRDLCRRYPDDRIAYTHGKGDFVSQVLKLATSR